MNKIEFRIWALQQDNLRRGDILIRCKDEQHKKLLLENIEKTEKEIERLYKELED